MSLKFNISGCHSSFFRACRTFPHLNQTLTQVSGRKIHASQSVTQVGRLSTHVGERLTHLSRDLTHVKQSFIHLSGNMTQVRHTLTQVQELPSNCGGSVAAVTKYWLSIGGNAF